MSGTKGGKKKLLIIAAVFVVVIAAAVIGIVLFLNSPARRLRRQIDLGARYLSELKYEGAMDDRKQPSVGKRRKSCGLF